MSQCKCAEDHYLEINQCLKCDVDGNETSDFKTALKLVSGLDSLVNGNDSEEDTSDDQEMAGNPQEMSM